MDNYEERVKKLQAEAVAQLQRDFAEAAKKNARDPVRAEREALAYELIKARYKKGVSQAELARQAGLRQADISRLETGKYNPSLNTLFKVVRALGANLVVE